MDVFISYSSQNKAYADKLADALRRRGFDVWRDREALEVGDEWFDEIKEAIKASVVVIFVMTPEAYESPWVKREFHIASHARKRIFPVLLAGDNWDEFLGTHYEDMRTPGASPPDYGGKLPSEQFYTSLRIAIDAGKRKASGTGGASPPSDGGSSSALPPARRRARRAWLALAAVAVVGVGVALLAVPSLISTSQPTIVSATDEATLNPTLSPTDSFAIVPTLTNFEILGTAEVLRNLVTDPIPTTCEWVSDGSYPLRDAIPEDMLQPQIPPRQAEDYAGDGTSLNFTVRGQRLVFVGVTPAKPKSWIVSLPYDPVFYFNSEFLEQTRPRLAVIDQSALPRERVVSALEQCSLPQWGVPPRASMTLAEMLSALNINSWHEAGIRGQNIRIGIIDPQYAGLEILLQEIGSSRVIRLAGDEALLEERSDMGQTDASHGTNVLRILTSIAPNAEYYLARAYTADEFSNAVAGMIGQGVQIIVHASNVITPEPEAYHQAVRTATASGVLWINSAGNIGAGYYRGTFLSQTQSGSIFHSFEDPNRQGGLQRALVVPVNGESGRVSLIWQRTSLLADQEGVPSEYINDLNLQLYLDPQLNGTAQIARSANNQLSQDAVVPALETADIPAELKLSGDYLTLPPISYVNDNLPDNVVYIFVNAGDSTRPPQPNTPFELFIEGALPSAFTPQVRRGFDPYVLVPGDIAESLTVGAYDPATLRMAWYSSRFNSSQYESVGGTFIKPDIVTFGELLMPDGRSFYGTGPSAAIVGGVAALLASRPGTEFDAQEIREMLTRRAIGCLEDGAVGRQIGFLALPPPDALENGVDVVCGSYEWLGDLASMSLAGR